MANPESAAAASAISVHTSGPTPFVSIRADQPATWNLAELWQDREILKTLVWRDIAVRYKETAIGFLWVALQPLLMMGILAWFSRFFGEPSNPNVTPAVRVFSSLLLWDFISMSVERSGTTLLQNVHIMSKIYFCRLIYPLAPVGANGFDFIVKAFLLAAVMLFQGVPAMPTIIYTPLILIAAALFTVAVSVWCSALTVFYKDIALAIPFFVRLLFFASPIFYEASGVFPEGTPALYHYNPIAALLESFNYCLLGTDVLPVGGLAFTVVLSVVLLVTGVRFLRYVETNIVDTI